MGETTRRRNDRIPFTRLTLVFKLHLNLLIHSSNTLSFSSLKHCTSQQQTKCSRRQITVLNETSDSAMLHVKSCNVKHNSESVFRYFASAVNSNKSTKCNRKDLYAILKKDFKKSLEKSRLCYPVHLSQNFV